MRVKAPVNKIIPFSAVDGPGNRTAVFTQGCSFHCKYCHNPETIQNCVGCMKCVDVCPEGALTACGGQVMYDPNRCILCDACIQICPHFSSPRIRWMEPEDVMEQVRRNVPFVRGITVSGGECTLHRDFLTELAQRAKREKLGVLLDSNGSYDFSKDPELLEAIDGVMLDVKAWDSEVHRRLTDCGNQGVIDNLHFLAEVGKLEEVRTVVIPDGMDAESTVRGVCEALNRHHRQDVRYKLISFRTMGVRGVFRSMRPPTSEEMAKLAECAHAMGVCNTVLI